MLLPGKGAHLNCNEAVLDFFITALDEAKVLYDEEGGNENIDEGNGLKYVKKLGTQDGWELAVDDFGTKAYKQYPSAKEEYRVTVVSTKRGELKLDIRPWYEK